MPVGNPQIGESWAMRDAQGLEVRGAVADVTLTIVTLVSSTGHRFRVAPRMLEMNWTFVAPAPRTHMNCGRRGCPISALYRYERDGMTEYVCPRHLPISVQAELLTHSQSVDPRTPTRDQPSMVCPSCASTATAEDLLSTRPAGAAWSWWSCQLCGRAWAAVPAPEADLIDAASRGRWYETVVQDALQHIRNNNLGARRIEMGPAAWGDSQSAHWLERVLSLTPRLSMTIEPATVHIILQDNVRPSRPRPPMPVSRLGGRPDRPATETVAVTETDRREFERHRNRTAGLPEWFREFFAASAEPATPAPTPAEREDPVLVEAARVSGLSIESVRLFMTSVEPLISVVGRSRAQLRANLPRMLSTLLSPGAPWKEKDNGLDVTVSKVEGETISLITTAGSEVILPFREFLDKYDMVTNSKNEEAGPAPPLPVKVSCGEEWEETRTGRVAKVVQIDSRRNTITLDNESRTGSTIVALTSFAVEWKPFVRASVYDRLISDEDL